MNDLSHSLFLSRAAPTQIPPNFSIKPVPKEISCFITSMLRLLPESRRQSVKQRPNELALGHPGVLSSCLLDLRNHRSLTDYHAINRICSFQLSHKQYEKQLSLKEIENLWWLNQSLPPCHMWFRPSGQTTGLIRDWTQMEEPVYSWRTSSERIEQLMDPKRNKKPCLSQS